MTYINKECILSFRYNQRRDTRMDDFKKYLQYQKELTEAKIDIIDRFQKSVAKPRKRTSQIDIVRHILKAEGRPLHVSDIITIARRDFQVELEKDSIVSAILKKVNAGKMFVKTAPNTFAVKEEGA